MHGQCEEVGRAIVQLPVCLTLHLRYQKKGSDSQSLSQHNKTEAETETDTKAVCGMRRPTQHLGKGTGKT